MTVHFPATLKERWQRLILGVIGKPEINNLAAMYRIELQELHSAERQLCALVDEIGAIVHFAPLAGQLSAYSTALRMRQTETSKLLTCVGVSSRTRCDGVMRALVEKTCRTAEQTTSSMRDTALMAALQHIVQYMITDCATLASHAIALGRKDEAAHICLHAQLHVEVDRELSKLATSSLGIEAARVAGSPKH